MTALHDLTQILGAQNVITDPADLKPYISDWTGDYQSTPLCVLRPGSTEDVSAVMAYCHGAGIKVVPQGGNTGLVGGSIASDPTGSVMLNLGRMNRIRNVDAANYTLAADAGCIVQNMCDAADTEGRLFPLSFGAMGSAQIGGAVSTNAGGLNVLRFGMVRDMVLGLEVVLMDGSVLDMMSGLRKDNRGPDLKQLFIATEGTLGIITGVTVKLFPRHTAEETAFLALRDLDAAIELFGQAREDCADLLTAFELIPQNCIDLGVAYQSDLRPPLPDRHEYYVLLKLSCSGPVDLRELTEQFIANAMEAGLVTDGTLASSGQQSVAMWAIREAMVLAQAPIERHLRTDVSVRVADIPDFIRAINAEMAQAAPDWQQLAYGHIGDGNVHFNMLPPSALSVDARRALIPELLEKLYAVVDTFGGSLSAEHGIGRTRREAHGKHSDPAALALAARLKAMLDPDTLLNPGSLYPSGPE